MHRSSSPGRAGPRKLPSQTRSLETVNAIVEAAARILETRGLDGFSTNAVAERAGVSIGSLYQYFPRKDALIGALILRETSLLLDEAELAAREADGIAGLSSLIVACVRHQFRRPALALLLDYEEARLPLDADTLAKHQRFALIITDMLHGLDARPPVDLTIAAQDIIAIIKGMVDAAGARQEDPGQGLCQRVERAVFGYLGLDR